MYPVPFIHAVGCQQFTEEHGVITGNNLSGVLEIFLATAYGAQADRKYDNAVYDVL